jgi:hypothetical protein
MDLVPAALHDHVAIPARHERTASDTEDDGDVDHVVRNALRAPDDQSEAVTGFSGITAS